MFMKDLGKWVPMPFIALGVALVIVDSTIVNVAIPSIIRDIGITTTDAEWVNSVYALVFASLVLITGRLGDLYGRKRLFLIGTCVFVAASLGAALAENSVWLIGARVIQGIGGAMILPASLSTVNAIYRGRDRAVAFGIWGATIGGTAALGPLLGGWLTESFSWRWAFLINLPIGVVIIFGLFKYVPETRDPQAKRGIDFVGAVLSSLGLGALVFALIEGQNYGWWRPTQTFELFGNSWGLETVSPSGIAFVFAAMSLVAFVFYERFALTHQRSVLLDLRLFSIRSFAYGNLAALIINLGEFGLLFALPLFLQSVTGLSALGTGAVLFALASGAFLAGPAAGQLAAKVGSVLIVRIGLILEIVGIVGIALVVSPTATGWTFVPWLFVYGLGVGFATAQITNVILADIPVGESGQGSAAQSTARQIGAALGTAVLGAVLVSTLRSKTNTGLQDLGLPSGEAAKLAGEITAQPSQAIPKLLAEPDGEAVLAIAGESFATATSYVGFVAALFIVVGLLATFLLPKQSARV
jgi:EmrB/QacA subfamily drug resistance transporter